jgi:thiosulfate dehydrogenase
MKGDRNVSIQFLPLRAVCIAATVRPAPLRASVAFCLFWLASGPIAAPASQVPLAAPAASSMPAGPLGDAIRLGQSIVSDTQTHANAYIRNGLNCVSCHLDGGRVAYAAPLVGLTGVFPEYRARRGRIESVEERINDCFMRSMNGKALPQSSAEMIGLLAYIAWLSQGVPTGAEVIGRGFRDITAPATPDPVHGKALYVQKCAACHGAEGQGLRGAGDTFVFPPLWGPQSFNTGAGMARVSVAAAFVQAKMPLGNGGTLNDQDAYDIAAYFTARPRPKFGSATKDWPRDGRPADAR